MQTPDVTPVPIVVMSTVGDDGEAGQFGHEQASALLVPPFQLPALRTALAAVILDSVGGRAANHDGAIVDDEQGILCVVSRRGAPVSRDGVYRLTAVRACQARQPDL